VVTAASQLPLAWQQLHKPADTLLPAGTIFNSGT
jgi:hypothetical protein